MRPGEQIVAEMLEAITSGGDLYVCDQYIAGPDGLERARELLTEKRNACSDPYEQEFLTIIIQGLEKGR